MRVLEAPIAVRRGPLAPCRPGPATSHEHAVLIYPRAGSVVMEQRGAWTAQHGDVLLVPPGALHRRLASEGADVWALAICPSCTLGDRALAPLLEPFERVRDGACPVVHLPEARRAFLESSFEELSVELARPGGSDEHVRHAFVTLILSEVRRASLDAPGAATDDTVSAALRVVEQRCLEPISLGDVARAVRRSPAHLTTAVRRATGRTVLEWIVAARMAEARRRLLHGDEHVDVVAERVGYGDVTHFIRQFRREHGTTPARWRAERRVAINRA